MRDTLNMYCKASGQVINFEKSNIFFSPNTPTSLRLMLSDSLGIKATDNPGKYLGMPTVWGRSKKEALSYVKERIAKKILGRKNCNLNQAGKEVLIKAVAFAVPMYPMSCFKFPANLCNEINSSIANFWWGSSEEASKIHWKNWQGMCNSKANGGMGFRDVESFNKALLAKQGWRLIQNPDSLWAQVIKGIYYPNGNFLNALKGGKASWAWSSLLDGREIIANGARWQVVNGRSIKIWADNWLSSNPLGHPSPNLPIHVDAPTYVAELMDNDLQGWDSNSINSITYLLSQEEVQEIKRMAVGDANSEDRLVWPCDKFGKYFVKSGYHWVYGRVSKPINHNPHSSHVIEPLVWKLIWHSNTLPKIKTFLWKAVSNFVPTMMALFKRKITITPLCPLCNLAPETIEHLLFFCKWAEKVWFANPINYKPNVQSITSFDRWISGLVHSKLFTKEQFNWIFTHIAFICWHIWKARCTAVYEYRGELMPDPRTVASVAFATATEFLQANQKNQNQRDEHNIIAARVRDQQWVPPQADFVKLNTDGSWLMSSSEGGLGVIARNALGQLVGGVANQVQANSVIQVARIVGNI